jgi:hypothetical protein
MAQVWLTFGEIQDLFNCDAADARRHVIANQWERRRGHDGLVRALLPAAVADDYMLHYRSKLETPYAPASDFEAAMAALRRVFAEDERDELGEASAASTRPESMESVLSIGFRSSAAARHALWAHSWLPQAMNDATLALARDAVA